jgi:hypothetical protein
MLFVISVDWVVYIREVFSGVYKFEKYNRVRNSRRMERALPPQPFSSQSIKRIRPAGVMCSIWRAGILSCATNRVEISPLIFQPLENGICPRFSSHGAICLFGKKPRRQRLIRRTTCERQPATWVQLPARQS